MAVASPPMMRFPRSRLPERRVFFPPPLRAMHLSAPFYARLFFRLREKPFFTLRHHGMLVREPPPEERSGDAPAGRVARCSLPTSSCTSSGVMLMVFQAFMED